MKAISREDELSLFLEHTAGKTFQKLENIMGISHSTLQRKYLQTVDQVTATICSVQPEKKELLVRSVLVFSMVGQMSSRNVSEAMALIHGIEVSHDTVLEILRLAGGIAKNVNQSLLDLRPVKTASFDEIFQNSLPILNFVDNRSGVTVLMNSPERTGEAWSGFLNDLRKMGLAPDSAIGDGGTGLNKGLKLSGFQCIFCLDLFHCLSKLLQAKNKAEGVCYALILAKDQTKPLSSAFFKAEQQMNMAIDLFDQIEPLYENVKKYAMLAHPEQSGYVTSQALLGELEKLRDALTQFADKINNSRKIIDARNYLKNNLSDLTAYKRSIENEVKACFGAEASLVFDLILP